VSLSDLAATNSQVPDCIEVGAPVFPVFFRLTVAALDELDLPNL